MGSLDDFEDGSVGEYSGDQIGGGSFTTTTAESNEGVYAGELTTSGGVSVFTSTPNDGLDEYPEEGTEFVVAWKADATVGIRFLGDDYQNTYSVEISTFPTIRLVRYDGGSRTTLLSDTWGGDVTTGWNTMAVTKTASGDIQVNINDAGYTTTVSDPQNAYPTGTYGSAGLVGYECRNWPATVYFDGVVLSPSAPSLGIGSATDDTIVLNFSSDTADEYTVYQAESSGSTKSDYAVVETTPSVSAFINSLENGERYYYRVSATNENGTSPLSQEVAATTDLPFSGIDSVDGSASTNITVNWSKADDSTDGGWTVEYRDADTTTWTTDATYGPNATTSHTISGLVTGQTYDVRLTRATDHVSSQDTATTTTAVPALTETSLVAASREVTATWTVADNNDSGDILVELKPTGGSWSEVATLGPDATEHTEAGLLDGERYRMRVTRRTDDAESPSSTTTAATTALPAPTTLSVANVTVGSADLSWAASHNYGDTLVQLKPVGGSWETVATVSRDTESYPLSMLRNGERYRARVRARTEHTKTTDQ